MAEIQVLDASFERLIDPRAPVQQIATGLTFTEGPVWHSRDRRLIFSDISNDTPYVWTEANVIRFSASPAVRVTAIPLTGRDGCWPVSMPIVASPALAATVPWKPSPAMTMASA